MVQLEMTFKLRKTTQKDLIREHLKQHGQITSWEAIQRFRCTRISEYIRQLRQDGFNIETKWATQNGKHFGIYKLLS